MLPLGLVAQLITARVGKSHEGVEEDEEMATDVLVHLMGRLAFKVTLDVPFESACMLWRT